MAKTPLYQDKFETLSCCVLIPTYNNAATLREVVGKVLRYTSHVVIVDDGSTDHTSEVLQNYDNLEIISLPRNRGKGYALRTGFQAAEKSGYEHAITMDSDGQHFPQDLPVFLDALQANKNEDRELLVIGSRKMDSPDVPQKSSVGNSFSSFWFWVETGVRLKDTQCGYRLYPLRAVNRLNLFTSRFELEIEVIVKAAWKGVKIINLPVQVYYDPEDRVTHFRPFQDVARITLLNIYFVGKALFYIAPRNIFRKIFGTKKKNNPKSEFSGTELPLK